MPSRQEKDAFFRHLDSLEDDSTASEEESIVARPPKKRKVVPVHSASRSDASAVSVANIGSLTKSQPSLERRRRVPPLIRAETDTPDLGTSGVTSSQRYATIRRTTSEPKRTSTQNALPTDQETLFAGFKFCKSR